MYNDYSCNVLVIYKSILLIKMHIEITHQYHKISTILFRYIYSIVIS